MATVIEAPHEFGIANNRFSIFLAGSIANGTAIDWQDKLAKELDRFDYIVVLNPRRKNWNWPGCCSPSARPNNSPPRW